MAGCDAEWVEVCVHGQGDSVQEQAVDGPCSCSVTHSSATSPNCVKSESLVGGFRRQALVAKVIIVLIIKVGEVYWTSFIH